MHVSSRMIPFLPEAAPAPRQPGKASSAAQFAGFPRIAGFPGETGRGNFGRRSAQDRTQRKHEEEELFDDADAPVTDVAQALSATLTVLELATRLGAASPDGDMAAGAAGPPLPLTATPPEQPVRVSEPSLDDLLAQAMARI